MNVGFIGLLQLVFIVLKVLDKIDWSWWLVFTPFYIWLVIYILAVCFVIYMDEKDPAWRFRK